MVEVFRTDVNGKLQAKKLLDGIHLAFSDYLANFDLEDCDRILRVYSRKEPVNSSLLLEFLKSHGVNAHELEDTVPPPRIQDNLFN